MSPSSPPSSKTPADVPRTAAPRRRQRLSTEERERQIIEGAIQFFSEHGLAGQMRELATTIGVSHPLVFHYFPSKKALIERVYAEVYLGRWKPEWEHRVKDRSEPFEERVTRVYIDYARTILTKEWVRILIHSALADGYINDNYLTLVGERLLRPIIGETRIELGLDDDREPTEAENELIWGLHGGIFYIGVRHWIYGHKFPENLPQVVTDRVRAFVLAAREIFPREAGKPAG
ncbi:TetR/AcrR family transcriptional regulator [Azospirillum sp. TSA2s]|uniref:TetR/AcrR family transcriptional regulator n=1 Tax=Azospirillum sp. TSA2s TaxID=709810 RepID=UPI00145B4DA4|nr:TetR/AcrR family transcriptional regulator [Azospirillum sp. TSA2s]